jgi:heptosyltransferase-2
VRRILAVRPGRLGDLVLTLPAVSGLVRGTPGLRIDLLTTPYGAALLRGHHDLGDVLEDDVERGRKDEGYRRLVTDVRERDYDAGILFHPTVRHARLLKEAGVPVRIGTAYRAYSWLTINRRRREHRKTANRHESDYQRSLAEMTGLPVPRVPADLALAEAERAPGRAWLDAAPGPDRPLVFVHPGSGGSSRDWPAARLGELSRRLAADGCRVVVTGGAADADRVEGTLRAAGKAVLRGPDRLPVRQFAGLLGEGDLFVGQSSGPLHLAAAEGVPTLSFFSPIRPASPRRWGPLGIGHRVLRPAVPDCRACLGRRCPHWDCMEEIGVDRAHREALTLLNRGRADGRGAA